VTRCTSSLLRLLDACAAAARGLVDEAGDARLVHALHVITRRWRPAEPPRTVLVVVDDARVRARLTAMLERHVSGRPISVRAFGDAATALRDAYAFPPILVLTELGMPAVDGLELCRRLRAGPWTRRTPVVAVSGTWLRDEAIAAGCAAFLPTPVRPHELAAVIAPYVGAQ
jgi:CheY-like chemotaxis protein